MTSIATRERVFATAAACLLACLCAAPAAYAAGESPDPSAGFDTQLPAASAVDGPAAPSEAPQARWTVGAESGEGSLEACMAAVCARGAGAVELLEDAALESLVVLDGDCSVTLDLQGRRLSMDKPETCLYVSGNAHLAVRDSAGGGSVSSSGKRGLVMLGVGSPSFTMKGGTLSASGTPVVAVDPRAGEGTGIFLEGGVLESDSATVSVAGKTLFAMSGGAVTSTGAMALDMRSGMFAMTGGSIRNVGGWAQAVLLMCTHGTVEASVSGGVIESTAFPAIRLMDGTAGGSPDGPSVSPILRLSGTPRIEALGGKGDPGFCDVYVGDPFAAGQNVVANDGSAQPSYYRGAQVIVGMDGDCGYGAYIAQGVDAEGANRFVPSAALDGMGRVFDGSSLVTGERDDPAVAAYLELEGMLGKAPSGIDDLRAVTRLAASMAADPALANQVHLLGDDGKAELVDRTQAAAAIDAFESAVATLPKADDSGAREALDAAKALYAAVPEAYRGDAFVSRASVDKLAAYEKAVEEIERATPLPQPNGTSSTASPLAATADPLAAPVALALAGIAAGMAAMALAARRKAGRTR